MNKPTNYELVRVASVSDRVSEATIRLYNSVLVDNHNDKRTFVVVPEVLKNFGYLVDDDILLTYAHNIQYIVQLMNKGIDTNKINNTFYTFLQTLETPVVERLFDQMRHYLSTYTYTAVTGKRNPDVYFPQKSLNTTVDDGVCVRVLYGITSDEIRKALCGTLASNAGVNTGYIKDYAVLINEFFTSSEIAELLNDGSVVNRDMRTQLAAELFPRAIPADPEEMIRLAILLATGSATKISSSAVLASLRESEHRVIDRYFETYSSDGLSRMAVVWRRNRKYFLAMKRSATAVSKSMINRARKCADEQYKAVPPHPVLNATKMDNLSAFMDTVGSVTIPQLVRAYNAFKVREDPCGVFLIRIRNGRVWNELKTLKKPKNNLAFIEAVEAELSKRKVLDGVKVFIPESIQYNVPSSARDMVGHIPNLTTIDLLGEDAAIGVHWYNSGNQQVDLDLRAVSVDGMNIGWNSGWSDDRGIIFTGDITDAPMSKGGAAEFMLIKGSIKPTMQLDLTLFAPNKLPGTYTYTMFIMSVKGMRKSLINKRDNRILSAGEVLLQSPMTLNNRCNVIGFIINGRFVICNLGINSFNVSGVTNKNVMRWVESNAGVRMSMRQFLAYAGAILVNTKEESDISLASEDLTAQTWQDLKVFS